VHIIFMSKAFSLTYWHDSELVSHCLTGTWSRTSLGTLLILPFRNHFKEKGCYDNNQL
jgi:hypothetical protein